MIRSLIRKELSHHWLVLLILLVLSSAGFGLIAVSDRFRGVSGSVFSSYRLFLWSIVPICGLVLSNRLVVGEFQAKTQLFLAALPMSRTWLVTVKYLIGAGVLLVLIGLGFGISAAMAGRGDVLTPRFLGIVAARALVFSWVIYNFFFVMGFLGRYRLALYLSGLVGLMALESATELEFSQLALVNLLDERFAFEKEQFPKEALGVGLGVGSVLLGLTYVLALVREGNVASLLAERMSYREKVVIIALFFGFISGVVIFDEKKGKDPFDLPGAHVEEREGIVVKTSPAGHGVLTDLARRTADELAGMRGFLGFDRLPPVFIVARPDLDGDRFERGVLEDSEGVHVRVNPGGRGWDDRSFFAFIIQEVVMAESEGRLSLERNRWVLDGFSWYWLDRENWGEPIERSELLTLRALYGTRNGFSLVQVREWFRFKELAGAEIAQAVAWSGLRVLAGEHGTNRCQEFLRGVLAQGLPKDVRAMFRERSSWAELEEETGQTVQHWMAQWEEELDRVRPKYASELARIPKVEGRVRFSVLSARTRQVDYEIRMEPAPETPVNFSLSYTRLPPFDSEIDLQTVRREIGRYPQLTNGTLPETYGRGSRIGWVISVPVDSLKCFVTTGWKREQIR